MLAFFGLSIFSHRSDIRPSVPNYNNMAPHTRLGWPKIQGLAFGGDYNPEQWPREVWTEDVRLMKKAGVNVVSLGIFSWSLLQPAEDKWDFGWLDDIINLLHKNGIAVDLATATASPPPWLSKKHPEILPVTADGTIISPGGRQHYRPTSPVFKRYVVALVKKMAERYGKHPAVVAWHTSNEYGCHNHFDYSDDAATFFREYLARKYDNDIAKLNKAWTTAFWSQSYGSFDEILPPRKAYTYVNPSQQLDWRRFSSDALLDMFKLERDTLRSITPNIPVTHNFMVMGGGGDRDHVKWADELDFVANDHYVTYTGMRGRDELSFSANFVSSMARGQPWWLMETSTSAVNWQAINTPKAPGEMAWHALSHVAQGADAICYFQWRQSRGGGETWHSSMVPHAGEDSRLFRDVCTLGGTIKNLGQVQGSTRCKAQVALVLDYESWWSSEFDSHPSADLKYHPEALDWYIALLDAGIRVDIVPAHRITNGSIAYDWATDDYKLVIAPILHQVTQELADKVTQYVSAGGHFVTTYFSGIINENVQVYLGGYPGAFKDVLGIRVEEMGPLPSDQVVKMDHHTEGKLWCEPLDITGKEVEVLRTYKDGLYPGQPAVTLNHYTSHSDNESGKGKGWAAYVSTRITKGRAELARELAEKAGVEEELSKGLRGKVDFALRENKDGKWAFYISRSSDVLDLKKEGVKGQVVAASAPGGGASEMKLQPKGVVVVKL